MADITEPSLYELLYSVADCSPHVRDTVSNLFVSDKAETSHLVRSVLEGRTTFAQELGRLSTLSTRLMVSTGSSREYERAVAYVKEKFDGIVDFSIILNDREGDAKVCTLESSIESLKMNRRRRAGMDTIYALGTFMLAFSVLLAVSTPLVPALLISAAAALVWWFVLKGLSWIWLRDKIKLQQRLLKNMMEQAWFLDQKVRPPEPAQAEAA